MTRSQRRAAAQAARKAAHKAGFPQTEQSTTPNPAIDSPILPEPEEPTSTISPEQLAANQRNAQKSTGAKTIEGKAKVARNAITHNLTGNKVMIPSEDVDRYETLIADYHAQFEPVGPEETYLLQSIIDIRWRLASIPAYEEALLDLGRIEMIRLEPEMANNPRPVIDLQVRLYFEKKFRNLQLHEGRLARRREREMKELCEKQAARKAADQSAIASAEAEAKAREEERTQTASAPTPNGFVFTPEKIDQFLATLPEESRELLLDALLRADIPPSLIPEVMAQTA
jgi:hypothetical protein